MPRFIRKIICLILIIYLMATIWLSFKRFMSYNETNNPTLKTALQIQKSEHKVEHVHIWGKAAIAEYLWLHILEGDLLKKPGYLLEEGNLQFDTLKISYATGPYLMPQTSNKNVKNLVIILNGREEKKIAASKLWLDLLTDQSTFNSLRNLGIVILGDERCMNDWLVDYLFKHKKLIRFAFIVYDLQQSKFVNIRQWPLGVATYRGFPLIAKNSVDIRTPRKYICNFLGTIYINSSRVVLQNILEKMDKKYKCYTKPRYNWQPKETKNSASIFHAVVKDSDLTLCPVGINSESYRIYEAISYGSVPVLEDVMTPGKCGSSLNTKAPYKLLKYYKAPVIFIKHWSELPAILENEIMLSNAQKIKRRQVLLDWYSLFRYKLRTEFLGEIHNTFV